MAITQTMTFSATPPAVGDFPDVFESRAIGVWNELKNNVVPDLNTAFSQINATEMNINNKEVSVVASVSTATIKAGEASASATEAAQSASEAQSAVASLPDGTINDAQTTLTNTWSASKISSVFDTLATKANPTFTGLITEEVSVSTLTLGATSSVQTYTATADFTIVDDLEDGESVTFIVTNAGFTPTFPTITWWNAEPTLGTTDKLFFEKIGSTLYGCHIGTVA